MDDLDTTHMRVEVLGFEGNKNIFMVLFKGYLW